MFVVDPAEHRLLTWCQHRQYTPYLSVRQVLFLNSAVFSPEKRLFRLIFSQ